MSLQGNHLEFENKLRFDFVSAPLGNSLVVGFVPLSYKRMQPESPRKEACERLFRATGRAGLKSCVKAVNSRRS